MDVYLVGGAVRDRLLNLEPKERDWVVVGASPSEMLALGYRQVGKDFPVFLHPETKEEYALARTERKAGTGYKGFDVFASPEVTLEQDLLRRDLTVNAIAMTESGEIIDPYHGRADLENRVLRHVSPAFTEDPLRVLRAARFAARFSSLGFCLADETLDLMKSISESGELDALVPERVWVEVVKTFSHTAPSRFFLVLRQCNALIRLFPEIDNLFGVPQRADYHPEIDTGVHTMMVLDQAAAISGDPQVCFAALTHDLGKAETESEILPSHTGHEKRSERLVHRLCDRFKIPNEFRDLAALTAKYHTHCHRAFELRPSTILEVLERLDYLRKPDRLEKFLLACTADSRGRTGFESSDYPQADYLRNIAATIKQVNGKEMKEQGLSGEEIQIALRRTRLQLIAKLKRKTHA